MAVKGKEESSISYKVEKEIGKLTTDGKMNKELRLISWNENSPKYDIRPWGVNEDGSEKMGKGITLTSEELKNLSSLISEELKSLG